MPTTLPVSDLSRALDLVIGNRFDGVADFQRQLSGSFTLAAGDFIL